MDISVAAAILGVTQDATVDEVRTAYRSHARLLHPDRIADASEDDKATAHRAMTRLNEARDTFDRRLSDRESMPPRPPSQRETIAQFGALLCHRRGWDLSGALLLERAANRFVVPRFRSDDTDTRGAPLIDEVIALLPGTKVSRGGRLDLTGGGHLIVYGSRAEADQVMSYINGSSGVASSNDSRRSVWAVVDRILKFTTSEGSGYGWYRN